MFHTWHDDKAIFDSMAINSCYIRMIIVIFTIEQTEH